MLSRIFLRTIVISAFSFYSRVVFSFFSRRSKAQPRSSIICQLTYTNTHVFILIHICTVNSPKRFFSFVYSLTRKIESGTITVKSGTIHGGDRPGFRKAIDDRSIDFAKTSSPRKIQIYVRYTFFSTQQLSYVSEYPGGALISISVVLRRRSNVVSKALYAPK